jgi:hypothetical protein
VLSLHCIISSALSIFWRKIGLADLFFSRQFCSTFSEKKLADLFLKAQKQEKKSSLATKVFLN